MSDRLWSIKEYPFHPEKLRYYETIFAIGNGYLGTRASFEEGYDSATPATLIHGIYNHAPTMSIPELVNAPDWTPITIAVDGTPFRLITKADNALKPKHGLVLGYERKLHMDSGLLRRNVLFRATTGATVRITFERFASLDQVHVMAQRVIITAIDGAPEITVTTSLNGNVTNAGHQHWNRFETHILDSHISLFGSTNQSNYKVAYVSAMKSPASIEHSVETNIVGSSTQLQLTKDETITVDKITTIYTSRDTDTPLDDGQKTLQNAVITGYDSLYDAHCKKWQQYWELADIQIKGDEAAQVGTRFTTYHVLIAGPQYDDDVSIGAKTLSGLGYKGHVFWDTELFMLPPFTLTMPHIARNMLMYRHKRLDGARKKAQQEGYQGAMFPWESTDTGEETTPKWSDPLPPDNERIRIWTGDNEQHISTDIAYAILQYWQWTGDDEFLISYGAEIILDTAIFWESRVEEMNGRYELHDQIGPDEYHENISNSIFVNRMVIWHLEEALKLLSWLGKNDSKKANELTQQLNLSSERLNKWQDIIDRMYIPFDDEQQIHIQFDNFFDMEYIPVQKYEPRVGGIWGYLGHERALQSQVIKQADVVMLMALLGEDLAPYDVLINNWNTYYPRCDHGSSLSPAMHAWVAARLGLTDIANHLFEHAYNIDLEDNKGNVPDGIHGAASGGLWQAIVFGFCGLHLEDGQPQINPKLPSHWEKVSFTVVYRGEKYPFIIEQDPRL
ncbi:MAG: glycosyl hydrolase family 65 protein [Chloroflexota bacterium]